MSFLLTLDQFDAERLDAVQMTDDGIKLVSSSADPVSVIISVLVGGGPLVLVPVPARALVLGLKVRLPVRALAIVRLQVQARVVP